jgi:hypothetical protein
MQELAGSFGEDRGLELARSVEEASLCRSADGEATHFDEWASLSVDRGFQREADDEDKPIG